MDTIEPSVREAIRAWRSTTELYANIFASLAQTTAPDPSSGKKEGPGHARFHALANTAQAALRAATDFDLSDIPKATAESATVADEEHGDDEESDAAGDIEESHAQPTQSSGAATCTASYTPLRRDGKKEWMMEQHRQRRAKKQVKRAARQLDAAMQQARSEPLPSAHLFHRAQSDRRGQSGPDIRPLAVDIEYEDLSAEVAARLKVKEERKAAAKMEKKRKRDSGGSVELAERHEGSKKKRSAADDVTINLEHDTKYTPKKHSRGETENVHVEARKKRRKG